MRIKCVKGDFSIRVFAGTHVVVFGFDVKQHSNLLEDLAGFAIKKNQGWMQNPKAGKSSLEEPIKAFQWMDLHCKPGNIIEYKVVMMHEKIGMNENKEGEEEVDIQYIKGIEMTLVITMEQQLRENPQKKHAIAFNRATAGSQSYARKFGYVEERRLTNGLDSYKRSLDDTLGTLNKMTKESKEYLSRGLEESVFDFLNLAQNEAYSIKGCFYEFRFEKFLKELIRLKEERNIGLHIIYDDKLEENNTAIKEHFKDHTNMIHNVLIPRKNCNGIFHNKFMVLLYEGHPIAVWFGSMNVTGSAIYGHANVGHVIQDSNVAELYNRYWQELAADPDQRTLLRWVMKATPDIPIGTLPSQSVTPIFSPRDSTHMLKYYCWLASKAKQSVYLTAAFGVNKTLSNFVFADDSNKICRYLISERRKLSEQVLGCPTNRVAFGCCLNNEQLTGLNRHVKYVHTKVMLIDPLSENPITITGSANFSDASQVKNDENMCIIVGETTVADIYFTEYWRLFKHWYYRSHVKKYISVEKNVGRRWVDRYYVQNSFEAKQRVQMGGHPYNISMSEMDQQDGAVKVESKIPEEEPIPNRLSNLENIVNDHGPRLNELESMIKDIHSMLKLKHDIKNSKEFIDMVSKPLADDDSSSDTV